MDDIARHLGISKKTLYQVVSDKSDLVTRGIQCYIERDLSQLNQMHSESENAIDEMFLIAQSMSGLLKQMHPSILFDLEKYYPKAFTQFEQYKLKNMLDCIALNIEDGIKQGYYRENINIPIVARLYIGRMEDLFDQKLFPANEFTIKDVYLEAIRYHIRGIASEKGIEYLKNKFKTLDTQNHIF